ncbi:MAG: rRNA pseudouridine synthase, partial [Candidatus Sumerlaeia bacterium]|nr:rRNA pseudouridine synthase [Candidatus Sumerlaeia bacterium]
RKLKLEMLERLQKYLARCGVASRRDCEKLILAGRVKVNGKVVQILGTKIQPEIDRVELDGTPVSPDSDNVYVMLNKPPGYVTSAEDEYGRVTVFDLVKDVKSRVFSVGRLDLNSRGLLLLTNDGELAYRLTHPRYKVEKEYIVKINGVPADSELNTLRQGIILMGGYHTQPAQVELISATQELATVRVVIFEGRKRQIKRMFAALGYKVLDLKRTRIGPLRLGKLPEGKWRYLTDNELEKLKHSLGLNFSSQNIIKTISKKLEARR